MIRYDMGPKKMSVSESRNDQPKLATWRQANRQSENTYPWRSMVHMLPLVGSIICYNMFVPTNL